MLQRTAKPLTALVAVLVTVGYASADDQVSPAEVPPPPTKVRFDPGAMPEPAGPTEGLGWRYANLSRTETQPLRRGFKLPMEALASAQTLGVLRRSAQVAPLPNPGQPFLPVKPMRDGAGEANPFTGSQLTSFRQDPMRALGEMLGADKGDAIATGDTSSADPFGGGGSDGGFEPAVESEVSEAPSAAEDDPFATGDDPFGAGGEDDPFGF